MASSGARPRWRYGFERVTTVVRLRGGGTDGCGEDVSPYEDEAGTLHVIGPVLPLAGEWTLESFCDHLDDARPVAGRRRAGTWRAAGATGRSSRRRSTWRSTRRAARCTRRSAGRRRAVRFVNSLGLGDPPTFDPIRRRLERHPALRFKLDATAAWTPALIDEVAATGAVEIIDFKGHYGLELRRAAGAAGHVRARDRRLPGRAARGRARPARRSRRCSRPRRAGSPTTRRSGGSATSTRRRSGRGR